MVDLEASPHPASGVVQREATEVVERQEETKETERAPQSSAAQKAAGYASEAVIHASVRHEFGAFAHMYSMYFRIILIACLRA